MKIPTSLTASTLAHLIVHGQISHKCVLNALIAADELDKAIRIEKLIDLINRPEITSDEIYETLQE